MTDARNGASVPRRMTPLGAAMWSLALAFVEQLCVGATEAARAGALTDIINLTACQVLATSTVLFIIARVYARDTSLREAFGVRRPSPFHVILAAVSGAGLCPLLSTVEDYVVRRWPYDPEVVEYMHKVLSRSSREAFIVAVFVAWPIARELFFRGALFGQLRRSISASASVIWTAVLFAFATLDWRVIPSSLGLGLALGWVRAQSGTVVAAVVAHLAFVAVEAVPIVRGRDLSADVTYPMRWIVGGAAASLIALAAAAVLAERGADDVL